ncbi:MAG: hypothetical protein JO270_08480, partial [Acidobacteriaceae bacterium]|nr:hypothetical protein [Acidobacteriaceae bacterium]
LRPQTTLLGLTDNQYLKELEASWKKDPAPMRTYIIAGSGIPTPQSGHLSPLGTGDGVVTRESTWLPNSTFYVAKPESGTPGERDFRAFQSMWYNHLQVVSDVKIMRQVNDILAADADTKPEVPR